MTLRRLFSGNVQYQMRHKPHEGTCAVCWLAFYLAPVLWLARINLASNSVGYVFYRPRQRRYIVLGGWRQWLWSLRHSARVSLRCCLDNCEYSESMQEVETLTQQVTARMS